MNFLILLLLPLMSWAEGSSFVDYSAELEHLRNGPSAYYCPPPAGDLKYVLSSLYKENKANCNKFIDSRGELGSYGTVIADHLDKISNSEYFKRSYPGMDKTCPKWAKFSKEQKKFFWVWFFAAIAWKESTCNEKAINKNATSGTAVGFLQLNEKKSARYWRGGNSGKSCAAAEVYSAVNNLKCGLEIFNEQLQVFDGIYEGNGQLAGKGSNSYWQDLRGSKASRVITMVKDFPGCK